MSLLRLDLLRAATLEHEPFEYFVVEGFVPGEAQGRLIDDYPRLARGGSFPYRTVGGGPLFRALCDELRGDALRNAMAEKLGMDLSERPTTLTVRGRCRTKDGQIHVDSKSKLVTVLLYLNEPWQADGGRLRLLRSGKSLDDCFYEAPPTFGTLLVFRNGPNAWHGHAPFEGVRRVLQLNYVTDETAARHSERRHGWSALMKGLNPFARAA